MRQLVRFLEELPLQKKVVLAVAGVCSLGGLILACHLATQEPFGVLFSGLPPEDLGTIVEQLKRRHIPYRLGEERILVPRSKVYELRLELAAQGLPRGEGVGFELFDRGSKLGMTEFEQRVSYQRALQGELARTICALQEVAGCRVHLVLPKRSLFLEREQEAQASVLLKLRRRLSRQQVEGIVHLVAASVPGLLPERVTVVDTKGQVLSAPRAEGSGLLQEELEFVRSYEQRLERKAQEMLTRVLGLNRNVVRVSAQFDFSQEETTQTSYLPRKVLRSEQVIRQAGALELPGGVPGVVANLPLPGGPPAQKDKKSTAGVSPPYQREETVRNYEVGQVTSRVSRPMGTLKRLSVAVLVDGIYQKQKGKRIFVARPPEELERIAALVRSAVGFDPKRGDQVEVACLPFQEEDLGISPSEPRPRYEIAFRLAERALPAVLPLVGLLAFLLLVVRPTLRWVMQQEPARRSSLPQGSPAALGGSQELVGLVESNPQAVAEVLREWVREGS